MSAFVRNYVGGCALCQQMKVNTHLIVPPLMPIPGNKDARPFSTITMDFITELPESEGYNSLFVVVDYNLTMLALLPTMLTEGDDD